MNVGLVILVRLLPHLPSGIGVFPALQEVFRNKDKLQVIRCGGGQGLSADFHGEELRVVMAARM
jgi:hypothetical protein